MDTSSYQEYIDRLRDEVLHQHGSTAEEKFNRVVKLVKVLRERCPWDRKQTPESLAHLLLEESYELVHAIDTHDEEELRKELGDLFLHVAFQAELAEEAGKFSFPDVFDALCDKLISRHPHVFGEEAADTEQQVLRNWETLKLKEKGRQGLLDGVPKAMSELLRAYRVQKKVAGVGFDWESDEGVLDKLVEEIGELREAGTPAEQEEEFGDLLFTIVNYSRFIGTNPEDALRKATNKFISRFTAVEEMVRASGNSWKEFSPEELDRLWQKAKSEVGTTAPGKA
ncbi:MULTISPECIES: nucleoside triphosphate pyrophosphohydrolase [Prosthecochloris]|uniref:Nucleoside triphosphate pyrophosphohydrolase n=1 Tax=Prosthecochloris vibrioformis TaxID=1098 RepID=A0A5C4S0T7_PROVB|nr:MULTISPECIES: nucleoside triphosphate pyrophosphohydrolase [Prosthecochloris]ANT63974.1 Nucleoside triphosphate pyrophosphohydrolase/pyrophosphatase MazG [Prosthecochloris sp. CIB 2401]TNJ36451.1 nucleoside triphosphate pyrophosphohydrolase [Prosthecochloris vibrioformis]